MLQQTGGMSVRPTALVTGATSGIGYELAKVFAASGHDLVLVARTEAKLHDVAEEIEQHRDVTVVTVVADLAQPDAALRIVDEVRHAGRTVDVLVNNAGFGDYGAFAESDIDAILGMLQVNVVTLTQLTRLVLPTMLQRRSGKILNVASSAAFQPGPFGAVYYASKAYVLSLSEAIAYETRASGVTVTALCPGPTKTGFQKRAGAERIRLFQSGLEMSAAEVARIGYVGLMDGRPVIIAGLQNRVIARAVQFAPRQLVLELVSRVHRRV